MTTQVLYNNSYGDGFVFSEAFLIEYEARTTKKLNVIKALTRIGPESIRCDPVAIAIFKEKGAEWCSGPTSDLALREFSNVFEQYWEIEEQDGDEHVRLLVSEALADILHEFVRTGDKVLLDRQYKAIVSAASWKNQLYECTWAAESEPADVIRHVNVSYGYFDNGIDNGEDVGIRKAVDNGIDNGEDVGIRKAVDNGSQVEETKVDSGHA